jgi:hypothetical protein
MQARPSEGVTPLHARVPAQIRTVDGMPFDRPEEIALYRVLAGVQAELPCAQSVLISVNPLVRVPGHRWKPDLLVAHHGRAGIIEVDGASHYGRSCADRSRDRLLEDAGIAYVDRLSAEEASNHLEAEVFVRRFLARLSGTSHHV